MISINDIRAIPFPDPEDLYRWGWPGHYHVNELPNSVEALYNLDIDQICFLIKKDVDYLVANPDNEICLLEYVIETIFYGHSSYKRFVPDDYDIWYDMRCYCGIHDLFWYSRCLECSNTRITELPLWCNELFSILFEEGVIIKINGDSPEEYYYCVPNYSNLRSLPLGTVYEKMLPIFINMANEHYKEEHELEELPNALENLHQIFNKLLDSTQSKYLTPGATSTKTTLKVNP